VGSRGGSEIGEPGEIWEVAGRARREQGRSLQGAGREEGVGENQEEAGRGREREGEGGRRGKNNSPPLDRSRN
jgi:hypothetical protein